MNGNLQLADIMGFVWNYMDPAGYLPFDNTMTMSLNDGDGLTVKRYRERYLDCQGKIDLLTAALADDIHRAWGQPEPCHQFKRALVNASHALAIVSQATAASVFGDSKVERKLKSTLRL